MKLMYGNVPVKSLNIHTFEMDTNSATVKPSDLQSGVTCFGKGKKITGTGKAFEFATYGSLPTNESVYVPSDINIIHVSSVDNPVKLTITLYDMKDQDFTIPLEIGSVLVENVYYPISVVIENNFMSVNCEQAITLEVFYGKDNYV